MISTAALPRKPQRNVSRGTISRYPLPSRIRLTRAVGHRHRDRRRAAPESVSKVADHLVLFVFREPASLHLAFEPVHEIASVPIVAPVRAVFRKGQIANVLDEEPADGFASNHRWGLLTKYRRLRGGNAISVL